MTEKFLNKYRIPSARLQNWDYRWAGAYFITICTQNREHYFGEIVDGEMILSPAGVIADVLWHEIKNHSNDIQLGAFVVMPNHIHGILILNGDYTANSDDNGNTDDNGNSDDDGNSENDGNTENVRFPDDVETGHALSLQPPLHQLHSTQQPPLQQFQSTQPPLQPFQSTQQPLQPPQQPLQPPQPPKLSPPPQPTEKTIGQKRFQKIGKNSVSSIIGSFKSAVTKHCRRLGFSFAWQTRFHDHIIRDEKSFLTIQTYIIENPERWEEDKFFNKE